MLRLIEQYLCEHGYSDVAFELQEKSQVHMEDQCVKDFRSAVLNGQFTIARSLLSRFPSLTEEA